MVKILIIEDEKRVADLLRAGLEENGYQTMVAYDGEMGMRLFKSNDFQLVISDIILPKKDGFEVTKEIRALNENVPILILTALGTADDKLDGFDAGADDYMVKPFDFRELMARVKVLTRRSPRAEVKKNNILTYADVEINTDRREVRRGGQLINLSPKEYNLFTFLVENADRVVSRIEIAENVWQTHFDTGTNFIDVCMNYLRKKVDRDFDNKLIHAQPGVGFILTLKTS